MIQKLLQLLIVGIFLAIFPPWTEFFELPKVLTIVILVPIMCVFYSASIALKQNQDRGISQLYRPAPIIFALLGLFIFAATFSSVMAGTTTSFWGQAYRYQGILFHSCMALLAFICSKAFETESIVAVVRRTIVWTAGISVVLVLLQGLAYIIGMSVYTFDGRMTGLIGNPNFAGGVIALSYPYLFFEWRTQKMALSLATIGGILAVLLTDSRGALIGLGVGMALLFATAVDRKKLLFAAVPVIAVVIYFFPQRALSAFDSRYIIWQKGWKAVQQKPIFGWGVENFSLAFQSQLDPSGDIDLHAIRVDKAHNEFLEILVATGVVGASLYCAVIGYVGYVLWKHRSEELARLQLICWVVFLILAQVNVLNSTEYVFLFMAIGTAALLDKPLYS